MATWQGVDGGAVKTCDAYLDRSTSRTARACEEPLDPENAHPFRSREAISDTMVSVNHRGSQFEFTVPNDLRADCQTTALEIYELYKAAKM